MTEEEVASFALMLKEAERIRVMIAQDDAFSNGGSDGIPIAAAPAEEEAHVPAMGIAA